MNQKERDLAELDRLWGGYIDPALRGAASGALLDIPEWIAKQINREETEQYIKEHEGAYRGGQLAGTVAGAFIPVGGLAAKGLQAIGKGAQAGSALAKAGELARMAEMAGKVGSPGQRLFQGALKGAVTGGAEAAIRAGAQEKENILGETATGAGFGGLAGAAGSLLRNAKPWVEEVAEGAEKANLGKVGLNSRIVDQHIGRFYKNASEKTRNEFQRDLFPRLSKRVDEKNLLPEIGREDRYIEWATDLDKRWNDVDKVAQKYRPQIQAMLPDPKEFAKEVIKDVEPLLNPEIAAATKKMMEKVVIQAKGQKNLADIRAYLQNIASKNIPTAEGQAVADAAAILRKRLDDAISTQMEKEGLQSVRSLAKEYEEAQILGKAIRKGEALDLAAGKAGGSPTFEKGQIQQAMAGQFPNLSLGAGATAGAQQDWENDPLGALGMTAGASILGAAAPKFLQSAKMGLIGKQAGALGKLADWKGLENLPKAGEILEALGPSLAGKAPSLAGEFQRMEAAKDEAENPEVKRVGPSPVDAQAASNIINQLLRAGAIAPEQVPEVAPRLLENLTPEMRIQYGVPKELQKDALEALKMSQALDLIPSLGQGTALDKARAQGAIYQAVQKAAGGNTELAKTAQKEVRKILSQPIGDSRKRQLIGDVLAYLDPSGYAQFREVVS